MNEREKIESTLDSFQAAIDRVHENVRLEAMWDPSVADPKIYLEDAELDEFLSTFANTDKGNQVKEWVVSGINCEAKKHEDEREICEDKAIGSVDFYGVTLEDSILGCRNSVRAVYKDIIENGVIKNGLLPRVTINGKKLPKIDN